MNRPASIHTSVAVVGGGVVGAAVLYTLAHRGVDAILMESDPGLAYSASGTNSGMLHTGFDSTPGELETALILRAAQLRPAVMTALGIPVMTCGAELRPHRDEDLETIRALADKAAANGVQVSIRERDGALLVPGEAVTDPVAYTLALARSAVAAGAQVLLDATVAGIEQKAGKLSIVLTDGRLIDCHVVINCAGLYADDVARMIGDDSFEIYPRKGEFLVFQLPGGRALDHILLPVPTEISKGVLVFPTLDGKVVCGPTAHEQLDKRDWTVRAEARKELVDKAAGQFPALAGLEPIAGYAGLRPAGRNANYVIGPSAMCSQFINVAAIRSTGLTASLGIGAYVADLLPAAGIEVGAQIPAASAPDAVIPSAVPWWARTADRFRRVDRV